jgi:D-beta-D-heptose 7-phosphate kinase/D-beta-D-heptose 1-phosphate adenosyltransferase
MKKKTIAVSGGFDPIHAGHVRMILDAATYGDVIVILNTDDWLNRKKGYAFMSWEERAEILRSIRGVVNVVSADDKDNTVCKTLDHLKEDIDLDIFANGGDRILNNTPEMNLCKDIGISLLWNCGGGKIQSSSQLIEKRKWSKDGIWNKPEKKNGK